MTGDIDLDGNNITGISSTPPTDTSIISKKYVKDNYVNSSGGTGVTGNLDMNTNIIFNLANDASLVSAVNREYVHSTFLQKSGGTMKGDINLNGNDINNLPNTPPSNSSAISKDYLTSNYSTSSNIRNTYFTKFGGRMQGILDMGNRNIIGIPDVMFSNCNVVNKGYIDNIASTLKQANKIIIYKELHFKEVKNATVWGQDSTTGSPIIPLQTLNIGSKSVVTILSISSDKETRTKPPNKRPSGLLDFTIQIFMRYYTDDGTTKGSGQVKIGTFKMSDFRYHEFTDGADTCIVYPVNI